MNTSEDLFRESIGQYQELINSATSLSEHMASMTPEKILDECEKLRELQKKQIEIDKFLIDIMLDTGPEILEKPYTREYQRQLEKAIQSCNKVATKAKAIRSLLQTEINSLKKGQQCLAGYSSLKKERSATTYG